MPLKESKLSPESLVKKLPALDGAGVLIVGDIMLDEYLIGDAARISPEAPVPVVLVEEERFMLGGAGNVARNISALGGKPYLISACGDGAGSDKLRAILDQAALEVDMVPLKGRPAATKTRVLARGQQLVRIDRENVAPFSQAETEAVLAAIEKRWHDFSVLIISDYNKGIVSRQFMDGLERIRQKYACGPSGPLGVAHDGSQSGHSPKILVDPKTGNFPLYQHMDLLTPNTQETGEGAGLPVRNRDEIIAAGRGIFAKIHCKHLLTTLGARGMALFNSPDDIVHIPTVAREVFDVSGAGDTVIATLALSLAGGLSLLESCIIANFAAGNVVAEVGTAVTSRERVAEAILRLGSLPVERWV